MYCRGRPVGQDRVRDARQGSAGVVFGPQTSCQHSVLEDAYKHNPCLDRGFEERLQRCPSLRTLRR